MLKEEVPSTLEYDTSTAATAPVFNIVAGGGLQMHK